MSPYQYCKAVIAVIDQQRANCSFIQRKLRIGYNAACEIIERMENEGIISPMADDGSRTVLINQDSGHTMESPQLRQTACQMMWEMNQRFIEKHGPDMKAEHLAEMAVTQNALYLAWFDNDFTAWDELKQKTPEATA